ncbi:MAG: DUF3783 domain-containing protein [Roseburia sp.]|nr:DUF3783 domain-containing protein [Roseburia sp.]
MEKLLLFGADDAEFQKVNQIASRLKLRLERVDPACYHLTLGEIASGSHNSSASGAPAASGSPSCGAPAVSGRPSSGAPASSGSHGQAASSPVLSESLLVMCHLSDKRMDKLLFELRRADVALSYKAVLTPTNAGWTLPRLMLEMQREKAAYAQNGR